MGNSRALSVVALSLVIALTASASFAAPAPAPQDKVRIAVMNFENNSQWHWWGSHLGEAAADEFVTQLFQSGEFSVVEREQINAILAEQDFGQSGRVQASQAAELGKILGVQVILTGSITKFSINEKGGGIGGFGVKYAEADSAVDVRLINVNTAEIMFADEAEGTKRLGGIRVGGVSAYQDYDAGLAAEALRPAVEEMAQKIAAQAGELAMIQPPVPPAQIVGAGDSGFYIDKGENYGVTVGQRYEVLRVVDEIKDANGNVLDRITERVGLLEVTRVLGQSSICRVVEGEAAEGDTLRPIG
jgi:curli biogenesis system outer membrane secretion channel CsgG